MGRWCHHIEHNRQTGATLDMVWQDMAQTSGRATFFKAAKTELLLLMCLLPFMRVNM